MAIPSARVILDQNLDIHYTGGAPLVGKTDASKAPKRGGLGGRKALNDISNSAKPSALQASKKHSNVISIGKDLGASKTPFAKASEKGNVGGRKALTDLTNTEKKPSLQQASKKSRDKKLSAAIDEGFLHNHEECIKAQRKTVDKEYFLMAVGLGDESPFVRALLPPSSKSRPLSPLKHFEMEEEMPVQLIEDRVLKSNRSEFLSYPSPARGSPISSPKHTSWNEDNFPNFTLIDTPKLPRR